MSRRLLVTSALPYANGSIHFGHLVEYIQTDIWVRFQKMQGHEVHYVCADDTHGTAIMLRAEKEGITPQQLIERVWKEHKRDFDGFLVDFDNYGSTDDEATKAVSYDIYGKLRDHAKLITTRSVEQFFDPVKELFLPDRFIKGTCPKCGAKDQYGDSCEVCGSTYAPTDLINPYSVISGATPVRKSSEHYFFALSDPRCKTFLEDWTQAGDRLQPEAKNKIREWFDQGLNDWDISRDAPYFGFEIPDAPGKYFYVWLDAPIGYLGSFRNLANRDPGRINFEEYVSAESVKAQEEAYHLNPTSAPHPTEMVHFIGKDILYFHALFWPATLHFAGYRTPTKVFAHGFLTVNGEKMSKSRGTFITAESYLKLGLNPEWLRYYYAAKLNSTMEDIDLNLDDFVARVNSDLVGKYVNIASRCAGFITKRFGGRINVTSTSALISEVQTAATSIGNLYDQREYGKALREVLLLIDRANQFVDQEKPWELAKDSSNEVRLQRICSEALNLFRLFTIYLKPVLPNLAREVESFLSVPPLHWNDAASLLQPGHLIKPYQHLMTRIDAKQIEALVDANKESLKPATLPSPPGRGAGGEGNAAPSKAKHPPIPEDLLTFARQLRQDQTDAERFLWSLLRDRRFASAKFRRQHPVETEQGRFILDFYSHDLKLAIELDGGQHQEAVARDIKRTQALAALGIEVLRFWNNTVLANTESVLESLWNKVNEMSEANKSPSPPAPLPGGEGSKAAPEGQGSPTISIDDFMKIDLRVAKVVDAQHVEGAEKMVKLILDIGTEQRQVFAGIKAHYEPEQLKGRMVVMVANLAPRKMRFGESQGMVLAASNEGSGVFLLDLDSGAQPGMRVK